MDHDPKIREEADTLSSSVMDLVRATELLIHLTTRLVNRFDVNDDEVKFEIQKAYQHYKRAKDGLEAIKFFETVN